MGSDGAVQLNAEQLALIRRRAEADLFYFARAILNYEYLTPEFHKDVCDFVTSSAKRKLIVLPRGHFKTTIATISYPIWLAIRDPNVRILIANATATNAEKFLEAIKTQFESNGLLRALWPEVIPDTSKVRWSSISVELRRSKAWTEATFEAIGVGGKVASRHYDVLIKDDLIDLSDKDDIAEVAPLIQTAINWHQYSQSLFVNPENGEEIVIGTRWFREDLIQWVKANQTAEDGPFQFGVYECPALRDGVPVFPRSEDGKHGFTVQGLMGLRRVLGPYKFSGQYLLDPTDPSVAEFQRTWLRYYNLSDDGRYRLSGVLDRRGDAIAYGVGQLDRYCLVDPALSRKRKADYTGLVTVGVTPGGYKVVLEAEAFKAEPAELIERIIKTAQRWRPIAVGVEKVAAQKLIKPFLEFVARSRGVFIPVREFATDSRVSKENRIRSLVPEFAQGLIFLGPNMYEFEQEYDGFPTAKDQHLLDALAYGPQLWGPGGEPASEEDIAREERMDEIAMAGRSPLTGY